MLKSKAMKRREANQATAPPGRMDYLPDSRILTPADKAERQALFMAFGANLRRARLSAGITQARPRCPGGVLKRDRRLPARGRDTTNPASSS